MQVCGTLRSGRKVCALSAFLIIASGCAGGGSRTVPIVPESAARTSQNAASINVAGSSLAPNAYQERVLQDAPAVFYTMADTSSVLHDSGSRSLNGAYGSNVRLGGETFSKRSGVAAVFPGANQYSPAAVASVPPAATLQPNQLSVEAWFTPSTTNASGFFQPIVAYGSEHAGNPYILQVSPENTLNFWTKSGSLSAQVQGDTKLSPGQTYHVVATDSGNELALYVNGKLEASSAGAGSPSYVYLNDYGLTIGGAADSSNRAVVNGAIDDVAIYPAALAASTVAAHYAAGTASAATWPFESEWALSADGFVDSVGLVIHLHYQDSPYDLAWPEVNSLLTGLRIRHIRDGLYADGWQPYKDRLEQLAQEGIRSTLVTFPGATAAQVAGYPALIPGSMEAIEGYNEPDLWGDPNWVSETRAWQQQLYQTAKSNAATANLTVMGPSVISTEAAQAVGNLSQWMDAGNIHMYFSARNPETAGWGGGSPWGAYGSIGYNLGYETAMSGSRPQRISETGYGTANAWLQVSPFTQAKYIARLYLDLYGRQLKNSMDYELVDGQDGAFGWYGLVDVSLHPKPAYNVLKALFALLNDPGPTFSDGARFNFHLSGNMAGVNHVSLQKRNGAHYLAVWLGVPSCDPTVGSVCADFSIAPQQLTLTTQDTPSAVVLYEFSSSGSMNSKKLSVSNNSVSFAVTDQVAIIEVDL